MQARQRAGLTQTALSAATGIPQSTISVFERGEAEPGPDAVFSMEDALNLKPGALSQLLGFVRTGMEVFTSIEVVISVDPNLDEPARQLLIQLYERLKSED